MSRFRDAAEFRKVFDLLFTFLSRDARFGPKLKALEKPQRFVITDLKLTLDVAGAVDGGKPGEQPGVARVVERAPHRHHRLQ